MLHGIFVVVLSIGISRLIKRLSSGISWILQSRNWLLNTVCTNFVSPKRILESIWWIKLSPQPFQKLSYCIKYFFPYFLKQVNDNVFSCLYIFHHGQLVCHHFFSLFHFCLEREKIWMRKLNRCKFFVILFYDKIETRVWEVPEWFLFQILYFRSFTLWGKYKLNFELKKKQLYFCDF